MRLRSESKGSTARAGPFALDRARGGCPRSAPATQDRDLGRIPGAAAPVRRRAPRRSRRRPPRAPRRDRGPQSSRTAITPVVSVPVLSVQITVAQPERLDRRQPADEDVARRHPLDADRERDGDDRRQPFRHRRDRERHRRQEHLEAAAGPAEVPRPATTATTAEAQRTAASGRREPAAAAAASASPSAVASRCAILPSSVAIPVAITSATPVPVATEVPMNTRSFRSASGAPGALGADASFRPARSRPSAPPRSSCRALRLEQARVGRDDVASFEQEDVARNDLGGRDHDRCPSRSTRARGAVIARSASIARSARVLLEEPDGGVDDDDRADGDRIDRSRRAAPTPRTPPARAQRAGSRTARRTKPIVTSRPPAGSRSAVRGQALPGGGGREAAGNHVSAVTAGTPSGGASAPCRRAERVTIVWSPSPAANASSGIWRCPE